MSVSGIGGSMAGDISQEILQQLRSAREQGMGVDDTASFLVEQNDGDGDGLLSAEESGFSEAMFNRIDANGDSMLSAEEIGQDMRNMMNESRQMMGGLNMMMNGMGESGEAPPPPPDGASGGSGSSGESAESDEEYDEFDLNQDGVVSMEELMIALQSGEYDLGSLLGTGSESGGASSFFQGMAANAYGAMELQ
jgi:hypothetical protein